MALEITISGTMDMARARQSLRKLGDEQAWPNALKVRAIAALTAMAETLYFARTERPVPLQISVEHVDERGQPCVELQTRTDFAEACRFCPTAQDQLERASDELVINPSNGGDQIVVRLWSA
jgi:hypothetical protein